MTKRIFTEEHRQKLRLAKLGSKGYWFGKTRPEFSGENHPLFGKPRLKETKEKISKSNKAIFSEELNPMWKGENVGYRSLHRWVEKKLGKPSECENCNLNFEGRKIHWANISGEYKRNVKDWKRLCSKCHGAYDKENNLRGTKRLLKITN